MSQLAGRERERTSDFLSCFSFFLPTYARRISSHLTLRGILSTGRFFLSSFLSFFIFFFFFTFVVFFLYLLMLFLSTIVFMIIEHDISWPIFLALFAPDTGVAITKILCLIVLFLNF
jgi:hypothetical protein